MKELEQILRQHAAKYPAMEPTDAVKLIYQNEFGGGHLIKDPQAATRYLQYEYNQTDRDPAVPMWEEIGNGIVRVNLAALPESKLSWLAEAFLRSAEAHRGNLSNFVDKLDILIQLTDKGIFPFDTAALEGYLTEYEQAGYPAVSHSPTYRNTYRPAYRIILKEFLPQEFWS
jgi:hypothetical protein